MQGCAPRAMEKIEIFEETYDTLRQICAEYDVSIAAIVGELVENFLNEALKSYGLI